MRKSSKLITAVAVAGLAFAGGTALTGTGLATTAPTTQFIGGQVSQSVTGATLAAVDYAFADADAKTKVNSITLAFTNTADGVKVAAAPSGGSGGTFSCTDVVANASTCTFAEDTTTTTVTETGYTGLTSLAVTAS
ncbi:hypothetical protein [Arthrobacter sp. H14]|uniref:hypothetical protein n=1 Tax=Arthrobacter sp. H14 TaxID=1312959 RepID=UPI0004793AAA|nr:hypothetical protein [Arthrobacter sp. H14]